MKRFIVVAVMVGVLATALSATAFAAPATPPAQGLGQGFGPGMGIHTPGTGLAEGATGFGMRGGMGQRGGAPAWAGQPDEVAKLLGLSEADIQKERLAGKSLAQIADAQGVKKDTLVNTLLSAKKATLDELVKGGKLDRAQADLMVSRMQSQVSTMVDRTTTGPAWATGANAGARPGMGMGGRWNR
jgi:hypothetical protein